MDAVTEREYRQDLPAREFSAGIRDQMAHEHTWRFSNSHNLYYCTTPGCRETWDDQS
jgi:hypothetical protein